MTVAQNVTLVLAQAPPGGNPGGQGEDFGKSSPVGLLLLVLFAIAVAFLVRSMSKHLKKLPTTFDENRAAAAAPKRSRTSAGDSADDSGSAEDSAEETPADAAGEAGEVVDGTAKPTTGGAAESGVDEGDENRRVDH